MKRAAFIAALLLTALAVYWPPLPPSYSYSYSTEPASPSLTSSALSSPPPTSPPASPVPAPRPEAHHPDEPSHPLGPEREWIQRENQLIGALNDAVDLNDVKALRRLIDLYREHDPSDAHKLQEGYTRIADCLQDPGPEARARAQLYYDTERASTVRRYVRRACFER